jgi:hypothetical protein
MVLILWRTLSGIEPLTICFLNVDPLLVTAQTTSRQTEN